MSSSPLRRHCGLACVTLASSLYATVLLALRPGYQASALIVVPGGGGEQLFARLGLEDHAERRLRSASCAAISRFTCDHGAPLEAPPTTASTRRRISADQASS
jgi:hypothetical protein